MNGEPNSSPLPPQEHFSNPRMHPDYMSIQKDLVHYFITYNEGDHDACATEWVKNYADIFYKSFFSDIIQSEKDVLEYKNNPATFLERVQTILDEKLRIQRDTKRKAA